MMHRSTSRWELIQKDWIAWARLLRPSEGSPGWRVPGDSSGAAPQLLQHYLLPFLETVEHLGLGAIGNPKFYGEFLLAVLGVRIRHFHRRLLVLVIKDGPLRNHEHVLVLFQDDFRVRGHRCLQLAARIVDGYAHFEGGDVVLLHAHGRDLGHLAGEGLVLE